MHLNLLVTISYVGDKKVTTSACAALEGTLKGQGWCDNMRASSQLQYRQAVVKKSVFYVEISVRDSVELFTKCRPVNIKAIK